ncbi:hypothetical protein KEHDKFFH_16655 [Marinobacter maroccanus]|uniref:Uncharacterized protein n=1 Tax=Marinobacter maroccanus TaxID=2055143 RepID=A0A2S5Z6P2_9GAMM|nr:hypothetical protein [Marinobacter maroccanus]PPI83065.1 hypothetical protein KEHDKFFH_16655 [Marinobacter maroccanus]
MGQSQKPFDRSAWVGIGVILLIVFNALILNLIFAPRFELVAQALMFGFGSVFLTLIDVLILRNVIRKRSKRII